MQGGYAALREVEWAPLPDMSYVRYTEVGLCAKLAGSGTNRLEVVFGGDRLVAELPLPPAQLAAAHAAVLAGALGRPPSAPVKVVQGKVGTLEVGPEFTTVTVEKSTWCQPLKTKEVTTVRTEDISYLQATLPSWQNALIRAIRDVEIFKIAAIANSLMAEDLLLLPVWPCSFFNHGYVLLLLLIKAISSIVAFVIVFLFRKTALIIGGPGPGKQVTFEPNEQPEEMLRGFAADFTAIGAGHAKGPQPAGPGKLEPVVVTVHGGGPVMVEALPSAPQPYVPQQQQQQQIYVQQQQPQQIYVQQQQQMAPAMQPQY